MAKVRVIPSTINPITMAPIGEVKKRKVAAYARVSTDSDEQFTSYEMQVKVYKEMIENKSEWEYVNVYADEGITGTNTKRRDGFNQMINDAKAGKIDLIVTKSISRFARNTLDTISITRELKAIGVEVYFEKENLWTLDQKSELILTILASIAQEESRSISQNVTIGKRWGMQEGKVYIATKNFLGYKKENGQIVIDEEEAEVVKLIYKLFLANGKTVQEIAKYLTEKGIRTPTGRSNVWNLSSVKSILTNEKYKGDALLQKTYVEDYLTHTTKKNKGKLTQYYVENSHPAIIDKELWEQVQVEMQRRAQLESYSCMTLFASRFKCEDCGGVFGRKVWHANRPTRKFVYICRDKYGKGKGLCHTPYFTEEQMKAKFIKAYNIVFADKERIIEDTKAVIDILSNHDEEDKRLIKVTEELENYSLMSRQFIEMNSRRLQNQDKYNEEYNSILEQYKLKELEFQNITAEIARKDNSKMRLKGFLKYIKDLDEVITEFDETTFRYLVEEGTISQTGAVTFKFYNGTTIKID